MPWFCLKNSFIHRLFMCYYCMPEEKRPKRKVRPPSYQSSTNNKHNNNSNNNNNNNGNTNCNSIETQTNISVSSSGRVVYTGSTRSRDGRSNRNRDNLDQPASSATNNKDGTDQSDGFGSIFGSSFSGSDRSVATTATATTDDVTPEVLMSWVKDVLSEDLVQEVNAVYKFVIINEQNQPQTYFLDLKNDKGSVGEGEPPMKADVVLTSSIRNMQLLMNGKLSKVSAYLTGRLKVEGDKNAAYNLDKVITLVQQS